MSTLKTTNIKGKNYVEVNTRLKYFREHFRGWSLETELVAVNDDTALMRAVIRNPEGKIAATGTAYERKDSPSSMVNKTSHVENCETSAWGRALGNLGIGIDASVASADEVEMAVMNQDEPKPNPQKPVEPPKKEKPSLTAVLEALSGAADIANLNNAWTRANAYEWTANEHKDLSDCYQNNLKKFHA